MEERNSKCLWHRNEENELRERKKKENIAELCVERKKTLRPHPKGEAHSIGRRRTKKGEVVKGEGGEKSFSRKQSVPPRKNTESKTARKGEGRGHC